MPEKASVYHVYPKNGVSTLCEKLADGFEDKIRLESPVEEIIIENQQVVAVKSKGETQEVSAVVSTAPANILAKLVRGSTTLDDFKNFRYRPMIFVKPVARALCRAWTRGARPRRLSKRIRPRLAWQRISLIGLGRH